MDKPAGYLKRVRPNSEHSRTKPGIEKVFEPGASRLSFHAINPPASLVGPQHAAVVRGALVAVQILGLVIGGFVVSREIVHGMP